MNKSKNSKNLKTNKKQTVATNQSVSSSFSSPVTKPKHTMLIGANLSESLFTMESLSSSIQSSQLSISK